MNPRRVKASLKLIGKVYRTILDETSQYVIPLAVEGIGTTKRQYDYAKRNQTRGFEPEPWGYTIHHDQPLRFKPAKIPNGPNLQVDIYCDVRWKDDDIPVKQDIKVRIWSQQDDIIFDPQRDSKQIEEELLNPARSQQGRVVSRFHFDRATPDQDGPGYHLQFGGIPQDYELCWHPEKVNVPRIAYQPMELFLTCQMVVANFFSTEYQEIKQKSEWTQELILYQNRLLHNYYEKCLNVIGRKESLLDNL